MRQETADAILAELGTRGWVKGNYRAADGKVCLAKAVSIACGHHQDAYGEAERAIGGRIHALFPGRGPSGWADIENFNDHPSTTWEDVVLVVKTAVGT